MQRRGGAGEQRRQSSRQCQKSQSLHGRRNEPSSTPDEPDATLPSRPNAADNDAYMDTSRTPWDKEESGGERAPATALATKKRRAANPYCPGCCGTFSSVPFITSPQLPQGLTTRHNPTHQGVITADCQEEENWQRVQDLWPGRHEWRSLVWSPHIHLLAGTVDKGAMPEPEMEHNYISLYKHTKKASRLCLHQNPKDQHQRRNKYKDIKLNWIKNNLFSPLQGCFFLIV